VQPAQTSKIGSNWDRTVDFEKGNSISTSAMYGGSYREPTFEQLVEMRGKR
jgi:hypothetical protein